MGKTENEDTPDFPNPDDLERFRKIRRIANHWSRPVGPRAYYWYLTFENSSELHHRARQCQEAISFPYYDLVPLGDMHITLERIAFESDITPGQLASIEAVAIRACQEMPPLEITIGPLGGTPSAIGFNASPDQPIRNLLEILREAALSVYPEAPVRRSRFHPHVAIAYANSDGPAAEAIAAVEKLNAMDRVSVSIGEGALVLLERRQRSYSWQAVSRIPLSG